MSHAAYIGFKCVGFNGPKRLPSFSGRGNGGVSEADRDAICYRADHGESARKLAREYDLHERRVRGILGRIA